MFDKKSRYFNTPIAVTKTVADREVKIVCLRRLPKPDSDTEIVRGNERLDVMAHRICGDGTRFWRIGDANSELKSARLLSQAGRSVKVPRS